MSPALQRPLARKPVQLGQHVLGGARSLLCAPLVGASREEVLAQARRAAMQTLDVVEWRCDYLTTPDPELVASMLVEAREVANAPVLVTCRAGREGGVGDWTDADRIALLRAALENGADAVDVELATAGAGEIAALALRLRRPCIVSTHWFDHTPSTDCLLHTLEAEQALGATVVKIAAMALVPSDVTRLLDAAYQAKTTLLETPLLAMSMGALGAYSRVIGPFYGTDLVFTVAAESSSPGQLPIEELRAMRVALQVP